MLLGGILISMGVKHPYCIASQIKTTTDQDIDSGDIKLSCQTNNGGDLPDSEGYLILAVGSAGSR